MARRSHVPWRAGLPIPEKVVRPDFPRTKEHEDQLREDLIRMGCEFFLDVPWDITDEGIILETVTGDAPAPFRTHKIRGKPDAWTPI